MAALGRAAVVVTVVVALGAVVVGALLPREVAVVRAIDVAAPRAAVLALVADLQRFAEWSPWFESEGDVIVTFPQPGPGVGQSVDWASGPPAPVAGHATIVRIDGDGVEISLDLGGLGPASAWFAVSDSGPVTIVTWGVRTDLGPNPLAHYLGPRIESLVGRDIERGLLRLKAIVEVQPVIG